MKTILLDRTTQFRQQLKQSKEGVEILNENLKDFNSCFRPVDFAKVIKALLKPIPSDEEVFIFINAHFKRIPTQPHHDCFGIDIAYELAAPLLFKNIKENQILPTIVLFSCLSRDKLVLKRPEVSSVFFLPVVDFIQIPFFIDEQFFQRVHRQSRNNLDNKKSLLHRKWSHKFSEDRHSLANRMGVYIMHGILNELVNQPMEEFYSNLPADVNEALFAFSRNLGGQASEDFKQKANDLSFKIKKNLQLGNISSTYSNRIALIDDEAYILHKENQKQNDLGWLRLYEKMIVGEDACSNFIINVLDMPVGKENDQKIKSLFNSFDPQGTLIDNRELIQQIGQSIVRTVIENNCICILLDIKLLGRKESNQIEQNSGTQLLRMLREELPTHPIIITTASNKANKHKILEILKADAIWIKEGLDQHNSNEESFWNYIRFLELIQIATGEEYQFLSRLGEAVEWIEEHNSKLWWENEMLKKKAWRTKRLQEVRKQDVVSLLNQIIRRVRNHLSYYYLNYSLLKKEYLHDLSMEKLSDESSMIKDIIVSCGKVIELIHGKKFNEVPRITGGTIGGYRARNENGRLSIKINRGDWVGFALYQLRNESAHSFSFQFKFNQNEEAPARSLTCFLCHFVAYLSSVHLPFHHRYKRIFMKTYGRGGNILNPIFFIWLLNLKEREKYLDLNSCQIKALNFHFTKYNELNGTMQGTI